MKKVVLSLAVLATVALVSCNNKAEGTDSESAAVESVATEEVAAPVESAVVESAAAPVESAAAEVAPEAAPTK